VGAACRYARAKSCRPDGGRSAWGITKLGSVGVAAGQAGRPADLGLSRRPNAGTAGSRGASAAAGTRRAAAGMGCASDAGQPARGGPRANLGGGARRSCARHCRADAAGSAQLGRTAAASSFGCSAPGGTIGRCAQLGRASSGCTATSTSGSAGSRLARTASPRRASGADLGISSCQSCRAASAGHRQFGPGPSAFVGRRAAGCGTAAGPCCDGLGSACRQRPA
jgi:hypothetical protein